MNVVVAVPVDESLASYLGKKGSADSIVFYNRRFDKGVVVVLFPNQEDEKIYAVAETLLLSSQVALSTTTIDRKFGEALVAASLIGKQVFVTNDNDVSNILSSSGLKDYKVVSREELALALTTGVQPAQSGPLRVDIDKAFPVRGIGTVALGIVTRGTIRQHDKLYHTSGKQVLVRSLQSQDEDVTSAEPGTRIGISLKDIEDDEIRKGDLLATAPIARSKTLTIEFRSSPTANEEIAVDKLYGIVMNFSYSECFVTKVEGSTVELNLSSPMPVETGDKVMLIRKQVPRIFASGIVKLASA